jgi:hypothetical protein
MNTMKKITNNKFLSGMVLSLGLLSAIACKEGLDSNLNNPSALSPEAASNEFVWNGVQLGFANFFLNVTDFGQDITRMRNMFGSTYENTYTQNSFNGIWLSAYADVMVNGNLLLSKTVENPGTPEIEYNPFYQGTTKVMKAYVLMTLVDYFGDIPYAQAFNTSDFNPDAQDDAAVYDSVRTMLESAVVDLTAVTSGTSKPPYDLYYGGNALGWRKAANSLLFKLHLNRRLIDPNGADAAMAALIVGNDMINANGDDFSFKYSANSQTNPNTYHPWFYNNYLTSTGPYMSNAYMKELYDGKGFKDPRIRYYFYRQVNVPTTDVNELTCSSPVYPYTTFPPAHYPPGTAYCQLLEGYWGRDHLNFEGTPPDGLKKTTYGVYPAGGRFDANDAVPVTDQGLSSGGKGKGVLPIMMSSYVLFMRAEHALMKPSSDEPGAEILLEQAVRRSIDRVMTFIPSASVAGFVPSPTGIDNYVLAAVTNRWGAATTNQEWLDIICKEYWVALWGNGVEAYNMYRRTGMPTGMQPALAANPGNFYRSYTYPGVYVVRNNSAVQKTSPKVKVFWDNNPDGFIN